VAPVEPAPDLRERPSQPHADRVRLLPETSAHLLEGEAVEVPEDHDFLLAVRELAYDLHSGGYYGTSGPYGDSQGYLHTYVQDGFYEASLDYYHQWYRRAYRYPYGYYPVWDIEDDVITTPITVLNRNPVITGIDGPASASGGALVTLTAFAWDPGIEDVLTYAWDLDGDGVYGDAYGRTVESVFRTRGIHTPGVRVTDGDGGLAQYRTNLSVTPEPGTGALVLLGFVGLLGLGHRWRRRSVAAS